MKIEVTQQDIDEGRGTGGTATENGSRRQETEEE